MKLRHTWRPTDAGAHFASRPTGLLASPPADYASAAPRVEFAMCSTNKADLPGRCDHGRRDGNHNCCQVRQPTQSGRMIREMTYRCPIFGRIDSLTRILLQIFSSGSDATIRTSPPRCLRVALSVERETVCALPLSSITRVPDASRSANNRHWARLYARPSQQPFS